MAAEMQDNLLKYRSPSFPHGAMCSQRTFESQTEKELMYYQDRLAGKGEESGDHLNTGGNAEINRLCESINKHKSDRDEYEALSANEKLKAIALKEDLKQRAEEARTAALENLDKDNRSGTPRRSPTTLPQEQPPPPRHRKNSWPYPPNPLLARLRGHRTDATKKQRDAWAWTYEGGCSALECPLSFTIGGDLPAMKPAANELAIINVKCQN